MKTNPGPVMLDVVGKTLTNDDKRRLAHPMTGGVILFARHYENRAQLVALTIGRDYGEKVEILSGLEPSDEVISDPSDSLVSGTAVHNAGLKSE